MILVEFLLARIAEDEAVARKCFETSRDWVMQPGYAVLGMSGHRVLAECEAKRRIVAGLIAFDETGSSPWGGCGDECEGLAVNWSIQMLALSYSSHPDYRAEWAAR